ncbi:hypothetical protein [Chitinophaga pinensis]|uniref:Lipid/polyisoprenoid-binding YceI-like domain-containing protein n=1 Tax=Chitinophaga pinensis (strain ATCC 43595 / DSM 2588 / LMG 13176 / NBRC 15968 / NCIMB 11800 / UQM 2034) TaxID=485918 RepID=A0A979G2U4_CHIPD|nr:hypothetical protein [Chitinophaga pinensis]ACU59907.1 hypothetical protein Cpin_2416 [Chitinophaga pinensis DSM 2588]
MKRLIFCCAIAVALFSACSKDKDGSDQVPENTFSLNSGNPIETPYGFRIQWSTEEGGRMLISNANVNNLSFSGKVTGIQVEIDTFVNGQTYMYMPRESASFDKKKNFSIATTGLDADFSNGNIVNGTGTQLSELRSGSIKIEKDPSETYRISYVLDYTEAVIQGNFRGLMPVVNN